MADTNYSKLSPGQRVAVNTGFYLLPGVVNSVFALPDEVNVNIQGQGERLVSRFDVYAIPDESDRLKDAIMSQTDELTRRAKKIITDGIV